MKSLAITSLGACGILSLSGSATPIEYGVEFTLEGPSVPGLPNPLPTVGSFVYDPAAGFSTFVVVYGGITFELTAAANAPILWVNPFPSQPCNNQASNAAFGFLIMSHGLSGCMPTYQWAGIDMFGAASFGFVASLPYPPIPSLQQRTYGIGLNTPALPIGLSSKGTWTITAIPEPLTGLLVFTGIGGLVVRCRFRR